MTRAEELKRKQERNRQEYERRLDRKREQSRQWYWKNRDYALAKAAATRQRKREEASVASKEPPPSIESLEAQLPYYLKQDIPGLRDEFLKIPILQRPPYDVFLKMKTIEYLKTKTI
jgi:hypothetical protein